MLRSISKPPLARSPIHLRSRRPLQPTTNSMLPPKGSLKKTQKPVCVNNQEETKVSCDLKDLTKRVHQEFGKQAETMDYDVSAFSGDANRSPLFERGRFYDEYSRRRNERLKKKKSDKGGEGMEEKKAVYDLGVRTEAVKRKGEAKKYESGRKEVVPSTPVSQLKEPSTSSRYLLRSVTIKKNDVGASCSFTNGIGEKKNGGARRGRRI